MSPSSWESDSSSRPTSGSNAAWIIGICVLVIVVLYILIGVAGSFSRTGPNEACVVYNGGIFDKRDQRQTIPPSSSLTWTGWKSQDCRMYPTAGSPRFYLITSDPSRGDRPGVDYVKVPTANGIEVSLEGKITFNTLFTGQPNGPCLGSHEKSGHNCDTLLSKFDASYGNRLYTSPDGHEVHFWNGDDGVAAFLDVQVRPVIDNAIRETLATIPCAELLSSCQYVNTNGTTNTALGNNLGQQNNVNLGKVQSAIATALNNDLNSNLGGDYFGNFRVVINKVVLPPRVDDGVQETLNSFAQVSKQQAALQAARVKLQVNKKLQQGYAKCPACATQDILRALPPTVHALGGSIATIANP